MQIHYVRQALKGLLLGSANLHAFVTWKPIHFRIGMVYFYPQETDWIHFSVVNTKYCDHQNNYNPHDAKIKVATDFIIAHYCCTYQIIILWDSESCALHFWVPSQI